MLGMGLRCGSYRVITAKVSGESCKANSEKTVWVGRGAAVSRHQASPASSHGSCFFSGAQSSKACLQVGALFERHRQHALGQQVGCPADRELQEGQGQGQGQGCCFGALGLDQAFWHIRSRSDNNAWRGVQSQASVQQAQRTCVSGMPHQHLTMRRMLVTIVVSASSVAPGVGLGVTGSATKERMMGA